MKLKNKRKVAGVLGLVGLIFLVVVAFIGLMQVRQEDNNAMVVVTNFPAYDFARAVVGEENVKMLVPPGSDIHSYEPTPNDLMVIEEAELFIYNGGESDAWVQKVIENVDGSKVVKMMDEVDLLVEEHDGETEYSEHVWTSLENAQKIVTKIAAKMSELKPENAEYYKANADHYNNEIALIDEKVQAVVDKAQNKTLVFGDKFPLLYFVKEYGLDYVAAFSGCAEEIEVDAGTVANLVDKIKTEQISVILKIELTSGEIAETIAGETGAKIMTFHSAHNVSQEDFAAGKTYVDIMNDNLEVLKEALNVAS